MTPEIKKEMGYFITESERLIADLTAKVSLAKYIIQQDGAPGTPGLPTSMPAGMDVVQRELAIIDYLQTREALRLRGK